MKYLTLDYIKAHSRIDYDCENDLIETYCSAAETAVLNLIGQTYDELIDTYGEVPDDILVATSELAVNFIRHREPVEQTSLSIVPYNFDLILKKYIIL
jgi:uncharacterized phage protein (predicted DNA packaging)